MIDQFRVVTSITADTWFTTGLMTSDGTDSGTKRIVTRGELIAIVIEANATPISVAFACFQLAVYENVHNFPYTASFTTSWVKNGHVSCVALQYDDDSYAEIWGDAIPALLITVDNVSNTTTPDEVGLKFKLPFGCKIDGYWLKSAGRLDHDIVLYDSNGTTVLTSLFVDTSVKVSSSVFDHFRRFSSEITLLADTFIISI